MKDTIIQVIIWLILVALLGSALYGAFELFLWFIGEIGKAWRG